jgi:hypothetical protein
MCEYYERRKAHLHARQTELEVAQRRLFLAGYRNPAFDAELAANSAEIAELNRYLESL